MFFEDEFKPDTSQRENVALLFTVQGLLRDAKYVAWDSRSSIEKFLNKPEVIDIFKRFYSKKDVLEVKELVKALDNKEDIRSRIEYYFKNVLPKEI